MTSLYQSVGAVDALSEHVYCVAIAFKMTEQVEQQICIKFCTKLQHSSAETIGMIQKAAAMGIWWLAASSWECACLCVTSHAEFLAKYQITQVTQPPTAQIWCPVTSGFFPLKRKRSSDHRWDLGKHNRAADGNCENGVRSQGTYSEGDWGVIVQLQCFMYVVSSSINVFIFHITWVDTFWTELIYHINLRVDTNFYFKFI